MSFRFRPLEVAKRALTIGLSLSALSCKDLTGAKSGGRDFNLLVDARAAGTGGLMLRVFGLGVDSVSAGAYEIIRLSGPTGEHRLIVRGAAQIGTSLVRVTMTNRTSFPQFEVVEAAAGVAGDYEQLPATSYALRAAVVP